jgi:hypothetical protein
MKPQGSTMLIDLHRAQLVLPEGEFASLRYERRTRLTAVRGTAWITIDHDPRDIVIDPGQHCEVPSGRRVVVHPLHGGATLALDGEEAAHATHRAVIAARDDDTPWWRSLFGRRPQVTAGASPC